MSKTIVIILIVLSIIVTLMPYLGIKDKRSIVKQIWMTILFSIFVAISYLLIEYSDSFDEIATNGYLSLFLFIAVAHALAGFIYSFMNYAMHKTGLALLCSLLYATPVIIAFSTYMME